METTSNIDYFENLILKSLSHGSGINCDWNFNYTDKNCKLSNSFQIMSEYGYNLGYVDFTIKFDVICINEDIVFSLDEIRDNFKLTFQTNSRGYYHTNNIMLRDYLNDIFYDDFNTMVELKNKEVKEIIKNA